MNTMVFNAPFLLLHLLISSGSGHWHGAPVSSCNDMLPNFSHANGHGTVLNRTDPPWFIKVYKRDVGIVNEYDPGVGTHSLVVEISGPKYRGFIVQARTLAGYSRRVGEFVTPLATGAKFLNCDGNKHTAVTNADSKLKQNVWFTWKPPRNSQGPIQFIATVVLSKEEVFANIKSEYIYPSLQNNKIDTRFCGRGMGCIHFGSYGCVANNSCTYSASWTCAHGALLVEMVGHDEFIYSKSKKQQSNGIGIVPHHNKLENGSVSCVLGRDFYWHSKKRRAPEDSTQVQLVPLGTNKVLSLIMQNIGNNFLCRFVRLNVSPNDFYNFYVSKGNGVVSIIRDESPIRLCAHPHLYVNLPSLNKASGISVHNRNYLREFAHIVTSIYLAFHVYLYQY